MAHPQSLKGTANKVASDQKDGASKPASWIPERQRPLDTEDIDSEWPAEPDENPPAVALPQIPKGPSVPADLPSVGASSLAKESDSEWPEAPPALAPVDAPPTNPKPVAAERVEAGLEVAAAAPSSTAQDTAAPSSTAQDTKLPEKSKTRSLPALPNHAQDPFVETKSKGGVLIVAICVAAAVILAFVVRRQSDVPPAVAPDPARVVKAAPKEKPEAVATATAVEPPGTAAPEPSAAPPTASAEADNSATAATKKVIIESFPISARVYVISGTKWLDQGFAPATIEVPPGSTLRVMLVKEGFRRRQLKVDGTEPRVKLGLVEQVAEAGRAPVTGAP